MDCIPRICTGPSRRRVEGLTNIATYGHATAVALRLEANHKNVLLSVERAVGGGVDPSRLAHGARADRSDVLISARRPSPAAYVIGGGPNKRYG
jgi:hypothetical protein